MFYFVLVVVMATDNVVQPYEFSDGTVGRKGVVYLSDALIPYPIYYIGENTTALIPGINESALVFIYVFRMTLLLQIPAVPTESEYAIVSLSQLPEFTLVQNLYGFDSMYYGPPPPEIEIHMVRLGCFPGLVPLDLLALQHRIADPALCGTNFHGIKIECSNSIKANVTVLSAHALNMTVYKTPAEYCYFKPDEIEATTPTDLIMVAVLIFTLIIWVQMTENVFTAPDEMLSTVTVTYTRGSYDIIAFTWTLILVTISSPSHAVYGFSILKAVPLVVVDGSMLMFAYVMCTSVGLTALLSITVGTVISTNTATETTDDLFTWGVGKHHRFRRTLPVVRAAIVIVVITVAIIAILSVWLLVFDDLPGAIITSGTVTLSLIHYSTPTFLTTRINENVSSIIRYRHSTAIYIRWSVEFLILTVLMLKLPHEIGGTLQTPFHTAMVCVLGLVLIGRTAQCLAYMSYNMSGTYGRHILHYIAAQTIWHVAVFSIIPVFSNTTALGNLGDLTLLLSFTCTLVVFTVVYAVSYGRAHLLSYNRPQKEKTV
jgi:hypothetical protein